MTRETENALISRLARKYRGLNLDGGIKVKVVTHLEDFLEDEWPKIKDKVLAGESGWWNT